MNWHVFWEVFIVALVGLILLTSDLSSGTDALFIQANYWVKLLAALTAAVMGYASLASMRILPTAF